MAYQWRTLTLSADIPRSESLLDGLNLMRGLRGWQFFGWLIWTAAVMLLGSLLIPGEPVLKILAALVLAGIGFGFQRKARTGLSLRRRALLEGLPVSGSVVRHGKRLNVFSSSAHVTVTALFWLTDKDQTATGILWQREALRDLPKGRQLLGLWLPDTQQIWLPLELGIVLDAEPLELSETVLSAEADEV